jgi:hypothetical protein
LPVNPSDVPIIRPSATFSPVGEKDSCGSAWPSAFWTEVAERSGDTAFFG